MGVCVVANKKKEAALAGNREGEMHGLGLQGGRGWALGRLRLAGPKRPAGLQRLSSPSLFKTLPKTEKQRKKGRENK